MCLKYTGAPIFWMNFIFGGTEISATHTLGNIVSLGGLSDEVHLSQLASFVRL